jgi:hypothetical protein
LKYYRAFVATPELRLEGVFAATKLDGQRDVHARIVWQELVLGSRAEVATAGWADGGQGGRILGEAGGTGALTAPESPVVPLPSGMAVFDAATYGSSGAGAPRKDVLDSSLLPSVAAIDKLLLRASIVKGEWMVMA